MAEPYEIGFFIYPQVHADIEIANDLYVEGVQCLSERNPEKDIGAQWLDFIISEEIQAEWASNGTFIPTVRGAEQNLPVLAKSVYETVEKYDSFAHLDLVFHPEVVTAIFANIQSVLNGDMTEQEAMDAAQAVAEKAPWVGVPQGEAG
jgi:ABC-type glycerol-3-phosphate transport system substrate-binding protein